MKRTCNNCKALEKSLSHLGCQCRLGHNIECVKEYYGVPVSYKPLEECEKPLTFWELCLCNLPATTKNQEINS